MLGVVLKILSVLGILLLVLLGAALAVLLLALFFPVSYRAEGTGKDGEITLSVRADWLFSLLRVRFAWPQPGKLTVKVLWRTLFETGREEPEEETAEKQKEKASGAGAGKSGTAKAGDAEDAAAGEREAAEPPKSGAPEDGAEKKEADAAAPEEASAEEQGFPGKKIAKIKYTIRSIYDKIKEIWENITYYTELLREEETKQLFSHACFRLGKIWKSIRPGRIRADVLFGTGAPDTTGYVFGIWCMVSPSLGPGVSVTPDFDRKVLEGGFSAAGHITAAVILWNAAKVLLDRKFMRFIKKCKAGRK